MSGELAPVDTVDSTASEPADDSVRADIIAAMAEHGMDIPERDQPTEQPDPAAAPAETSEEKTERLRNERGQFTAKPDGAEKPAAEGDPKVSDADPAEGNAQQPSSAVATPTSWSADAKAEWSKLSPAVQQAVAKRENEIAQGQQRWSEREAAYSEVLTPIREVAGRYGVDERETINRLVNASNWLENDPPGFIAALAQRFGLDLTKIAQPQPTQGNRPQPSTADPAIAQLSQTVAQLAARADADQKAQAARINADSAQAFDAVAKSPDFPYFADVMNALPQYIQLVDREGTASNRTELLKQAYDRAVWANPAIREKLIAAQAQSQDAARKAEVKQRTEKARRGAVSINGSAATVPAYKPPQAEGATLRDDVVAAYRQHAGG